MTEHAETVSVWLKLVVTLVYEVKNTLRVMVCTPTVNELVVCTVISPFESTVNSVVVRAVTPVAGASVIEYETPPQIESVND